MVWEIIKTAFFSALLSFIGKYFFIKWYTNKDVLLTKENKVSVEFAALSALSIFIFVCLLYLGTPLVGSAITIPLWLILQYIIFYDLLKWFYEDMQKSTKIKISLLLLLTTIIIIGVVLFLTTVVFAPTVPLELTATPIVTS